MMAATGNGIMKQNGNTDIDATEITYSKTAAPLNNAECLTSSSNQTRPSPSLHEETLIPVPPVVPTSGISIQINKLWIGNLDKRLTEQNILKFVSPYGKVVSFKYLLHTSGIEKGEPRGYCFVEYSTREEAEKAKSSIQGKLALGKKLFIDWARPDMSARKTGTLVSETWDPSTVSATLQGDASTKAKIAAIEAKLRQMEDDSSYHNSGHSSLKQISSTSTAIVGQVYSAAKGRPAKQGHNLKQYRLNKPYSRAGIRARK